jgi:hypothetical protein
VERAFVKEALGRGVSEAGRTLEDQLRTADGTRWILAITIYCTRRGGRGELDEGTKRIPVLVLTLPRTRVRLTVHFDRTGRRSECRAPTTTGIAISKILRKLSLA